MYEKLVESLRNCVADENGCCFRCPEDCNGPCQENLMKQAADAIEELNYKYQKAIGDLVKGSKPKWILVTERLPEDMVDVLCYYEYFRYGNYNRMYRTVDRGHVFEGRWFGEAGEGRKNRVIAWMPLPEPPKEET